MRTGFGERSWWSSRGRARLAYEGGRLDYKQVPPLEFIGHHPGRISDDTQQAILVAEILLERGWLDPVELSTRLQDWVSWGVGKGRATVDAIRQLAAGVPWHAAGLPSAGNGAVMRVAPVGLRRWSDGSLRWTEAALSAFPTHHDRMAVASAVVMADAVASLIVTAPDHFDARRFADELVRTATAWVPRQVSERRDPASRASLAERLAEVPAYLDAEPAAAIRDHFWIGAFVLESLPAAVWCFLRHAQDPGEALREALRVGHDTDTVASLAGHAGRGSTVCPGCPPPPRDSGGGRAGGPEAPPALHPTRWRLGPPWFAPPPGSTRDRVRTRRGRGRAPPRRTARAPA